MKFHLNDETAISGEHEIFGMKSIIILIQNTTEWHGRAVELHSAERWRRFWVPKCSRSARASFPTFGGHGNIRTWKRLYTSPKSKSRNKSGERETFLGSRHRARSPFIRSLCHRITHIEICSSSVFNAFIFPISFYSFFLNFLIFSLQIRQPESIHLRPVLGQLATMSTWLFRA